MRASITMIRCSSCKRMRHPEEFNLDSSRKSGRQRRCRACCKRGDTPRNHKREWTERDDQMLIEGASRPPEMLAQRLGRTERALEHRRQDIGLTGSYVPSEEWGNRPLGKLLGRHHCKLIQRWTEAGLRAYQVGNRWKTTSMAIKDFLECRPEAHDLTKVPRENLWLLGLHNMPIPPSTKIIVCSRCGAVNRIALHAKGNCSGCQTILGYWSTHGYEA